MRMNVMDTHAQHNVRAQESGNNNNNDIKSSKIIRFYKIWMGQNEKHT